MQKSKTVFKGRLLRVQTQERVLPNGHHATIEWVEHPGAVLIVPFIAKNKVILLKQYRPAIKKYIYELPAGTLEKGESPLKCARREIIEETGYGAGKITRLGLIYPVPGYSTEKIVCYKAESLKHKGAACEADEVITTFTATRKEVRELFRLGKLPDAKTVCALAMCGWL